MTGQFKRHVDTMMEVFFMRHQVQCLFTFGKAFKRHGDIA